MNENRDTDRKKDDSKRISMHEGIGDWCDCCSCEAESRWEEVADKFGIDLGDYEEK